MNIFLAALVLILMLIRARAQGTVITMAEQIQIICNYSQTCID
jgi:hypothetical protein